jgi:hypothetical protein
VAILPHLSLQIPIKETAAPAPLEIIDLKDLPPQVQEQMRTVGVIDGKVEDKFNLPILEDKPIKSEEYKQRTVPTLKNLGEAQRSVQKETQENYSKTSSTDYKERVVEVGDGADKKNLKIGKISSGELIQLRNENYMGPASKLSPSKISEFASTPMDEYLLSKSSFNFKMSPPRGVPIDQLNPAEKIFYSFNKRTFESYINAFITTYRKMALVHPQITNLLNNDLYRLVGKMTFDKEGNIISIKMVKWANHDLVQKLFEDTLTNIRALQNPPKALLDDNEEFYIYFQLNIND